MALANDLANIVIFTAASFAVAFVSWHLYEKHFLRLKRFFEYGSKSAKTDPKVLDFSTLNLAANAGAV